MAKAIIRRIGSGFSVMESSSKPIPLSIKSVLCTQKSIFSSSKHLIPLNSSNPSWVFRNLSHGTVSLVISQGQPKFETHEVDPPRKEKWLSKKRLKMKRKREKQKRKAANKKDPRRLGIKGKKKKKFANAEERIKFKLEKAKIKEGLLIERLKKYEVPKLLGPVVKPHDLTGEERFFMKKMAQKRSNYVPVGRRGIFGGVILNMHMHWKKHETVKVICNNCKPGHVQEYAEEIARLSGGIPIQVIGNDTIIFYRGKDYVMPKVMCPIDTLSKKRALEKSKYEQSLESVRHFIAIAEKELELYYRHIALYGDPNDRNPTSTADGPTNDTQESSKLKMPGNESNNLTINDFSPCISATEVDSTDQELSGMEANDEDEDLSENESDSEDENLSDFDNEESQGSSSRKKEGSFTVLGSSSRFGNRNYCVNGNNL
ncbi:CRS1_YhbY domain-containing protein [Cephalotus follicularis]|uniref:CRS1_YhbY domain-containing protein n=1 Tax=Cephalotus follicularis TaxID=3775 RepID=A0A1Q3DIU1_CEPFO|nr:CRS1_YhbY domain-containing protein [Cephalotus follicularis]